MLFNRKAQSTAEYAIIIGVVVGAVMAVGVFLRGGIEQKVRGMTNAYITQGTTPLTTTTSILDSSMNTTSTNYNEANQAKGSSAMTITSGGGTATLAETQGVTKRTGNTTYFKP